MKLGCGKGIKTKNELDYLMVSNKHNSKFKRNSKALKKNVP